MDKEQVFRAHMEDLFARAEKIGLAVSKFLTPAEAAEVSRLFGSRRDVSLLLDGGFEQAERVLAAFVRPDWGEYVRTEQLAALRLDFRAADSLTHRDILGALMGLGIEREVIGDILCQTPPAFLVCLPAFCAFITDNLTKAGRAGVTVTRVPLSELPARTDALTPKTATVASLRLDAVLGVCFNLSRGDAGELIRLGRVTLAHVPCEQPAKEVREGDIVAAKGLGRAKIVSVGGLTRKGRVSLTIGLYV